MKGIRQIVEAVSRGGVGPQMWPHFFRELRFCMARLDVPAIRESLVNKLMAAIDDALNRAQKRIDV